MILFLLASLFDVCFSSPPNVILIMADDLGWADVAPYNPSIEYTPNIAKLAQQGVRYMDYHAAASVCTPSRAGLLTGRLGPRTGVTSNFGVRSVAGLPLTEHTMGDYMREAGYATGIVGKWHLGHNGQYHPLSRGFDYWLGLPFSNDMGCVTCSPVYNKKINPECGMNKDHNISVPLFENRDIIEQPVDLTKLSDRYTAAATNFMSTAVSHEKPFFLYAPLTHVHVPLATDPRFAGGSGSGHFGDAVMEMDDFVGQVMGWVREKGLLENTLVMFTSDNGPWEYKCELAGCAEPYMGIWQKVFGEGGSSSKMTTWEGGHRVPFIVSWPGKLPANKVGSELVSAFDILPTLAAICGFELPTDRVFDGIPLPFVSPHNGTRVTFHLDAGFNEIWALRYGKYKVYYATYPDHDCFDNFGSGFLYHNPALVFDTEFDPMESSPLMESEMPQGFYRTIEQVKKGLRDSVHNTFRSTADYSTNKSATACCNWNNPYCSCDVNTGSRIMNF